MLTRSNLNTIKKTVINDLNSIDPLISSVLDKDALLSGSFLLQSISQEFFSDKRRSDVVGTVWDNFDIDIFCTASKFEEISCKLFKNGYIQIERQWKWVPFETKVPTHYCSHVFSVHDFTKGDGSGPIVQLIVCENHPIETIRDFDFDLLENTFDGENLEIKNYDGIQNKTITIQNKVKYNRIEKYKIRGFTFTNEPKDRHGCGPHVVYNFNKTL